MTSWQVDPFKRRVVRHEGVAARRGAPLDDRMTPVDDRQVVAIVNLGLDVVAGGRAFRQRRQHVERGQRARRRLDSRRLRRDGGAQAREDLQLALQNPLVGAQHLLFVLLERGGDEPLAAGDRLLADVIGGHRMEIRPRDLDVVPEDAVVTDLQRADAGAPPLVILHLGDDLLARSADAGQLIELRIDAVAREPAVARERGRIIDERRLDPVAHVGQVVELGDQRADERRLEAGEHGPDAGDQRQRLLEADQIARSGGAERRPRDQALQIEDRLDRVADPAAIRGAKGELLDGVEAIVNRVQGDQRPQQPGSQHPAAHRRHRPIELAEERALAAALRAVENLQVLQRDRIDQQGIGALPVGDRPHVGEIDLLCAAKVLDQRPGGGDGDRMTVETEAFESSRPQLIEQRPAGRLDVERPRIHRGDRQTGRRDRRQGGERCRRRCAGVGGAGDDDLTRFEHGELVGERLQAVRADVLGRGEFTGRQVEQGDSDRRRTPVASVVAGSNRHQERRLARLQVVRVGQRAGRHHADHFALDQTLRLARILDLIADGDAKALLDQAGDVVVDGVKGHAAHRDPAAVAVLRSRGERELQRAGGDQGVLEEHLVEIAHAEKQNRIAILLLGVQILAHRRGRRR